jgi:hypothetical protein
MKAIRIFAIVAVMLVASTVSAQIAELAVFNGLGSAKKLSTDSTIIGEENFLTGSFHFFSNRGIGLLANYSDQNSWFDTPGLSHQHYEIGLGYHKIGIAPSNMGMDESYNSLVELTAGYFNDTKNNSINYVDFDGTEHPYKKLNKTDGVFVGGKVGLFTNDNDVKFFSSHLISGKANVPVRSPVRSHIISTLDSDTLVTMLQGEDTALVFYAAAFKEEVFSFPVSLNFAIAGDVGIAIGNLNNYQFGKALTYSASLKIKNYQQRNDCNSVSTTLELGFEKSNHYGYVSTMYFVKLDILGFTRMLKRS